ncbi:MAG: DinB family protein [Gemmataceae bacterium]|nr:DinB family protein [Gemmataceae bacterium]
MTGVEAVLAELEATGQMPSFFLADFSDSDLTVCPLDGANHAAWQVGHLIAAERFLLSINLSGAAYEPLAGDFEKVHSRDNTAKQGCEGFLTKEKYLELFQKTRAATCAAVKNLSDKDLDAPSKGPLAQKAPTLGKLLLLVCQHTLMHLGQWSVIRRKLGKPILF